MLFRSKSMKVFLQSKPPKININGLYSLLCNSYSNIAESQKIDDSTTGHDPPELLISDQETPPARNTKDQFLIHGSRADQQMPIGIKAKVSDTIANDVDLISQILKNPFESPGDVMEALVFVSFRVSHDVVEQILKRFSNQWTPAFGFFNWAKLQKGYTHSADLYNAMVDILGKSKRFDLMWELVKEMNQIDGYVSLVTMTKVMRRFSKVFRYKDAIEVFRKIEQFGLAKDVGAMNALMDSLVKEKGVEHAQEVLLELKDVIHPNFISFNILIDGWCKAKQVERAMEVRRLMEKEGFRPDLITYTCFVELYCRRKEMTKVIEILQEMQENSCPPDSVIYTMVIHVLGKAKEIDKVLAIYEKAKENGCVLDVQFYSSIIFSLCNCDRLREAREVFDDMSNHGLTPDVLAYNTLISAICEHYQEDNALNLLHEMEKRHCQPDLRTYAPLLKMCCKLRRMQLLYFLLNHMFENNVSLDREGYTLLVQELCKTKIIDQACFFFEEMVRRGFVPKDSTFHMLRKEIERKGLPKANEKLGQLMSQAKLNREFKHNTG